MSTSWLRRSSVAEGWTFAGKKTEALKLLLIGVPLAVVLALPVAILALR